MAGLKDPLGFALYTSWPAANVQIDINFTKFCESNITK